MHRSLLFVVFAVFAAAAAADITPADSSKPLFRILKFRTLRNAERPQDMAKGEVDDEHPLLVIWKLRDVELARDNKGVLMTLTPEDTRRFAAITRRFGYLLFDTGEFRSIEVLHITAPITDGIIGFRDPKEAP